MSCAERAIAAAPHFKEAWLGKAAIEMSLGDLKEAIRSAEHGLKVDEAYLPCYELRALLLMMSGRDREAHAALRRLGFPEDQWEALSRHFRIGGARRLVGKLRGRI